MGKQTKRGDNMSINIGGGELNEVSGGNSLIGGGKNNYVNGT